MTPRVPRHGATRGAASAQLSEDAWVTAVAATLEQHLLGHPFGADDAAAWARTDPTKTTVETILRDAYRHRSDRLLEVAHAARRLSVSHETVRSYIRDGLLPALRLPRGTYRIRERALEAFMAALER